MLETLTTTIVNFLQKHIMKNLSIKVISPMKCERTKRGNIFTRNIPFFFYLELISIDQGLIYYLKLKYLFKIKIYKSLCIFFLNYKLVTQEYLFNQQKEKVEISWVHIEERRCRKFDNHRT